MGGIWVSLPLLCPGGANKQINWSASGRKRRSKGLLLSNRKKKKGSINGKCKQCTSCHSAPSVANSIARTFFLAVLTSQCFHSMYRHCAGSANTRVNIRWISSSPWGFCAQEWEKVHHKERCHKSLSSHGAMLHAIRASTLCLTSLHPGISTMPIIRHITKKNGAWCGDNHKTEPYSLAGSPRLMETNLTRVFTFLPPGYAPSPRCLLVPSFSFPILGPYKCKPGLQ